MMPIEESGAWFPPGMVAAACRGYILRREADAARLTDDRVSALLRRRWWAPWRRPTMAEALRRAGPPLRWPDLLAVSGRSDDRRVASLLALSSAAGFATVWLSASDAALLAPTFPSRSA